MRQLTGRLGLSGSKIFLKADSAGAPKVPEYSSSSSLGEAGGGNGGAAAAGALDLEVAVKDIRRTLNLAGAESLSSEPVVAAGGSSSSSSDADGRVAAPALATPTTLTTPTTVVVEDNDEAGDSHFLLRCGALALSADVYDDGGEFHMQASNLGAREKGAQGGGMFESLVCGPSPPLLHVSNFPPTHPSPSPSPPFISSPYPSSPFHRSPTCPWMISRLDHCAGRSLARSLTPT